MFCSNCGKEIPENTRFCSECGAPVEREEVVTAPVEETPVVAAEPVAEPAVQEAPVEEAPVEEPAVVVAAEEPAAEEKAEPVLSGKKGRGKALGIIAIILAAIVVIVVGVIMLISGGGKSKTSDVIGYVTDDYELMYLKDTKEKTEAVEVSDEANYDSQFKVSPDGKYVYFLEYDEPEDYYSEATLMRMEISKIGKDGYKAEKVDSDVYNFYMLENGNVVYSQVDDDEYTETVYLFDGKETAKLVKDAYEWALSEDKTCIYYAEMEDTAYTDTYSYYRIALKKDAEEEELLEDVEWLCSDVEEEVLVYAEFNGSSSQADDTVAEEGYSFDPDEHTYTVYTCEPGGEETEVLDNAEDIFGVEVDGKKVSFYYTTIDYEKRVLYDFVTDNCADEDRAIMDQGYPEYPDYPSYYYDYEPYYLVDDATGTAYAGYETYGGMIYYFEGGYTTSDFDEAVDLSYAMADPMYEEALAAYEEAEANYYDYEEKYYAAQDRQWIREELQSWDYPLFTYDIYKYENGESKLIAENVDYYGNCMTATEAGILLYSKVDQAGGKVVDIEELYGAWEVYDMLEYNESDEAATWYINVNGVESEMAFDTDDVYGVRRIYVLNDSEVVLRVEDEDGEQVLEAYQLGKDSLTFQSVISDEFDSAYWSDVDGKDAIYFFEDVDTDDIFCGDLVRYMDGKTEVIAQEVYECYILKDGAGVYALFDMDRDKNGNYVGELAMKKGDDWVTIDDEASEYNITFLEKEKILYMNDGDLYLWNGKESRRIAKDVMTYWTEGMEYDYF